MALFNNNSLARFGKNFLLVLLSLVISLCLMEICLRFYNPLGFRIKGDKVILPVNKNEIRPHYNCTKLEKNLTIHRNSLGFRGEEPPSDFADWLTIVAVGGSTTECRELADDKTWPQLLATKLKEDFHHLWLNNAGLSGHSTYGHLALVRDYIVKLKPKVVIFLVGCNDIGLTDLNGADKSINKGLTLSSFRSLERFLAPMSDYSEVAAAMLNLKRYFFPKIETLINYDEIDFTALEKKKRSAETRATFTRLCQADTLNAYRTRLENLINITQGNGITPIMVTQPAAYGDAIDDVTGVDLGNIRATKNMDGGTAWEVMEAYNDVTRKICKEKNILLIDLAREMPKSSRYYYDLVHYTNAGTEKVAEIIFANLKSRLEQNYRSFIKPGQKSLSVN